LESIQAGELIQSIFPITGSSKYVKNCTLFGSQNPVKRHCKLF